MRTPIYLLVILALVNQAALLAGLATFMAKFIERQFSQTSALSNMMIGERPSPSASFELGYRRRRSRTELKFLSWRVSRRSLYPAGSSGHRPGRGCDAKVETFCERCQQVVHGRHRCLPVLLRAPAADRLLHPDGWWNLSSWVITQSVYTHTKPADDRTADSSTNPEQILSESPLKNVV